MSFRFQSRSRSSVVARLAMACVSAGLIAAPPLTLAAIPLTLQEAAQLAIQRAPMLDARRAGIASAQEESARAGALPDPMLTIGIDSWPVNGPDAFDFRAEDMTMKKIGLRQELPAQAKRKAQRVLAARSADQAQAQALAEQLAVRRAAAEAWVDLWAAQRELDTLQQLRDQAALAARVSKARVAGGGESVSDTLATEAAMLELDSRLEAARATRSVAQAALARWLGEEGVEAVDPPDFGSLPIADTQLHASVDRTGALLPLTALVETAAAAIDAARAEKRPDWSIAASYGQRAGGRSDMIMLEVGIGLPLFPRNRQDRGIAAREADYQAALATREDMRRQEIARIRAGIARWEGLKRQVALYEESLLPLANDRSTTALAAYRAGGDLQPWLNARRDELEARQSHVVYLSELGRAWAALTFLVPAEDQR
jgi:cobalt-zinc-cadmium efflux system outer membrane protein